MTAPAEASRISVAISHQDTYVAAGISALLRSRMDFTVQVGDLDGLAADVLVTDYATGLHRATETARSRRRVAASSSLIVTDQNTGLQIRRAVDAGIRGYVLQDCSAEELSEAVRCVAAGRRYLSDPVAEQLLDSLTFAVPTPRELEVLQLIARGLSNKDIGRRLGIGEGTVKTHVKAILGKLGESTRTGALREARRRGLLSEERPSVSRATTADARVRSQRGELA
ncbi:response regulator transcription factor [Variovorax sp. J2P1-59]|uniref:LuxR C-terminal-related transcriptional regulator n=1 Tax=Variovorax flavidus TaxID=3053501 RepID=UPI002577CDD1|nr:response regulator transcription factor [Variovorax sp. J2P1-59]MDM0074759.1 response regulator transcription factor [Variovorax sp. J2P1-59]